MIPLFKVNMPESVGPALIKTLYSGFIGQGPKVEEFENELSNYIGNPYCMTTNSGTSAIHLALRLSNVGPGDEVITTPMTCTATNMPILERGAKIVWADINSSTGTISPSSIESKITNKTKAVMCVHWSGISCDLLEIRKRINNSKIKIIEDSAHAFGSTYCGNQIGKCGWSDFCCFSFQAIKHLTTVDGGALFCRNQKDYDRGKLLRWYGIDRTERLDKDLRCEIDIKEYGYKFHMNDVCATIGIEQLKYISSILGKHRSNALCYVDRFRHCKNIKLLDYEYSGICSFWMFTIRVQNRDLFIKKMKECGIMASKVHVRNDKHTCFKKFYNRNLHELNLFDKEQVSIPCGWWLTDSDLQYIEDRVVEVCENM